MVFIRAIECSNMLGKHNIYIYICVYASISISYETFHNTSEHAIYLEWSGPDQTEPCQTVPGQALGWPGCQFCLFWLIWLTRPGSKPDPETGSNWVKKSVPHQVKAKKRAKPFRAKPGQEKHVPGLAVPGQGQKTFWVNKNVPGRVWHPKTVSCRVGHMHENPFVYHTIHLGPGNPKFSILRSFP